MSGSPRPSFDQPTHIPYEMVTRHMWGDEESGRVVDWIYVSNDKVHQLVFSLPPGGCFRHSNAHRTIFAADEVYYVLSGALVIANPETGEVHLVNRGEAVFFQRDTWHHGFSYGSEPLKVLEFFAPPPSQGTSSAYAKTKPNLTQCVYKQDQWIGQWPMASKDVESTRTMTILRDSNIIWRMEGQQRQVLTGILASTNQLTVGKILLLPGQETETEVHGGDESLYLPEGRLALCVDAPSAAPWFELKPGDGFYLPQGTPHRYCNISDRPVSAIFCVAPNYLSR